VQNFELVWMDILCEIINSTIEAARVLENRPWSVADRPLGGRGPSGPLARTVRPPSADRPDPNRAIQFYSFYCGDWYQLFIYGCLSPFIAVVWVVSARSLQVASNQSALVEMMLTIHQPLIQRPNPQLGALNLWTQKTFLMYIPTIQLTPQDGHFQSEGFLWLSTAQGGL
jgi:hypothetical protein